MNLIKDEIQSLIPPLDWTDFSYDGTCYVAYYCPQLEDETDRERYLHLRGKYPSDYAAAVASKLPEFSQFVDYDHMSLKLRVIRND
jgi:hypothetical protein